MRYARVRDVRRVALRLPLRGRGQRRAGIGRRSGRARSRPARCPVIVWPGRRCPTGVAQQDRGDEREHDDAADGQRPPHASTPARRFGRREIGAGVERADDGRGARRVVVVQRRGRCRRRRCRPRVRPRGRRATAAGSHARPRARRGRCRVTRRRLVVSVDRCCAFAFDDVFVVGGRREPGRRGSSAGRANTIPAPPSTSATTGMPQATMPMPPFDGVSRMCSP